MNGLSDARGYLSVSPGVRVSRIAIVLARSVRGKAKRSVMLVPMRELDIEAARHATPSMPLVQAMPVAWCLCADGRTRVWPDPDRDYDYEIVGAGGPQRPTAVPTVEAMVASFNKAAGEVARMQVQPERVERFTLGSSE